MGPSIATHQAALLLDAVIEATPDSHGDKENLHRAKAMVEEGSRGHEKVELRCICVPCHSRQRARLYSLLHLH